MKTTALPTSKAKTAYGLLSDIARIVLAEPKRLAMGTWRDTGRPGADSGWRQYPACGTVACIGGWTDLLRPKDGANQTLGLTNAQAHELFMDRRLLWALNQQTPAHARATARHIARFQKKYAAQLKSKRV